MVRSKLACADLILSVYFATESSHASITAVFLVLALERALVPGGGGIPHQPECVNLPYQFSASKPNVHGETSSPTDLPPATSREQRKALRGNLCAELVIQFSLQQLLDANMYHIIQKTPLYGALDAQ